MSKLVQYQYDSDEETRRLSTTKDDDSPMYISPEPSATSPKRAKLSDEEMSQEVQQSPEVTVISSKAGRSPLPLPRSPFIGSYADQFKRKATPVHVEPGVQKRYDYLFYIKGQGRNLEQELDGNKTFKNPALYDCLTEKFAINSTGSGISRSARVFTHEDFTEDDFYDQLALYQEGAEQPHHKSKSKHR